MKIWGRLNSINVQKVIWAASELALPFERVDAGMEFGVVNTPAYLAKNPNGLVPSVEVDGLILWESNVIIRYLAAKYSRAPEPLSPPDPAHRALADCWMEWQQTTLNPSLYDAFVGLIRTKAEDRDDEAIHASLALFNANIAILDTHLSQNEFVAGADFTMGDIPCGATVHRWRHLPATRKSWPNVERWYRSISARPAARDALLLPIT